MKTEIKKITIIDLFIKRCIADFTTNLDLTLTYMRSPEKYGDVLIHLILFILYPVFVLINFGRIFTDATNPEFSLVKEYYEYTYHAKSFCDIFSLAWNDFVTFGYTYPEGKALEIIERALTIKDKTLTGVNLTFKSNTRSTVEDLLLMDYVKNLNIVTFTFGNKINRAIKSLIPGVLLLKEWNNLYLKVKKDELKDLEEALSVKLSKRIKINLI